MEFRLLYSGRLLGASRTNTRADLKHTIRREFHPQLRRLWATNQNLRNMVEDRAYMRELKELDDKNLGPRSAPILSHAYAAVVDRYKSTPESFFNDGISMVAADWERNGFRFIPLVSGKYHVRCSLDILFLRPEKPGAVVLGGDLDNRVKTLFDALRMPSDLSETGNVGPQTDEDPFYCLLEDDKLISEIRIVSDQLLLMPLEREIRDNDVFLVINVRLNPVADNIFS